MSFSNWQGTITSWRLCAVLQSAAFFSLSFLFLYVHECLNNLTHSPRHVLFINYAVLYSRNLFKKKTESEEEGKCQMMITKPIEGLARERNSSSCIFFMFIMKDIWWRSNKTSIQPTLLPCAINLNSNSSFIVSSLHLWWLIWFRFVVRLFLWLHNFF